MTKIVNKQLLGVLVVFAVFALCGATIAAESMTIVGTITSGFRGGVVSTSPDGTLVYTASGQDGYIYVTRY